MRAALEQGGGQLAQGGLARGVTHVVCAPEAALRWLAMGVGIVSPAWVAQSLRAGRQQRCLSVSADASRHLPAAGPTASPAPQHSEAGSGGSATHQQALPSELLSSREARRAVLAELAAGGDAGSSAAAGTPGGAPGAAHQQAATPAELLTGLLWSVLEPPSAAWRQPARPAPLHDPE